MSARLIINVSLYLSGWRLRLSIRRHGDQCVFARYIEARRYVDGMPTKGGFEQTDGSY